MVAGRLTRCWQRGASHDKGNYAYGTDPRGWAWDLKNWTPSSYGFNDYKYTSQSTANAYLMAGIRATSEAVGAVVARGHHAFDVVGFYSSMDPFAGPATLYGFYVIDPWYYRSYPSGLPGGPYNLAPNTYIVLGTWNSNYFTQYLADPGEPTYWNDRFVDVLRKSTNAAPSDTPAAPYSDLYGNAPIILDPPDPGYPVAELVQAVTDGLRRNALTKGDALGVSLANVTVGAWVHVDSAIADFPSYYLTELRRGSRTLAIALVTEGSDGLHFGAVRATGPAYRLPDRAFAEGAWAQRGKALVRSRLTWGWSEQSWSPFMPFVEGVDADGHASYLGPSGWLAEALTVAAGRQVSDNR